MCGSLGVQMIDVTTEILTEIFGHEMVDHTVKYRECHRGFYKENFSLISRAFYPLLYYWQTGKAREYLETLHHCVQCCLIGILLEDYVQQEQPKVVCNKFSECPLHLVFLLEANQAQILSELSSLEANQAQILSEFSLEANQASLLFSASSLNAALEVSLARKKQFEQQCEVIKANHKQAMNDCITISRYRAAIPKSDITLPQVQSGDLSVNNFK